MTSHMLDKCSPIKSYPNGVLLIYFPLKLYSVCSEVWIRLISCNFKQCRTKANHIKFCDGVYEKFCCGRWKWTHVFTNAKQVLGGQAPVPSVYQELNWNSSFSSFFVKFLGVFFLADFIVLPNFFKSLRFLGLREDLFSTYSTYIRDIFIQM